MILVTAANGNQGKLLIPKLLATGGELRACVRSDESARTLNAAGVPDVVVGDITDPTVLARAMRGVEKVYYVGPALHPEETQMGFAAIDAARNAGVSHFVFSSVLHAIITDLVQHQSKRDIEENLVSSRLEFTILQPANYMLRHRLVPAFEKGVFRLSWSLERYQSMVDVDDVTEVAAAVLSDPRPHAGATYELVAPGRYTAHDLAGIISGVTVARCMPRRLIRPPFSRRPSGSKVSSSSLTRPRCCVPSAPGTAVMTSSETPTYSRGCSADHRRHSSSSCGGNSTSFRVQRVSELTRQHTQQQGVEHARNDR